MPRLRTFLAALVVILFQGVIPDAFAQTGAPPADPASPAALTGTGFTYQGTLVLGGQPVNATCAFQFSLFDALSSGAQIGSTQTVNSVDVAGGQFTVLLNDAGQFGPAPFHADARWLAIAVKCPPAAAFAPLAPRQALTPTPFALALPGLHTEQNATSPNIIGGYSGNSVTGGAVAVVIAGGGASGVPNSASAYAATVSGGILNEADDQYASVGGGYFNVAGGEASTASGGQYNAATGTHATVAGGLSNSAGGFEAAIGGGSNNVISPTADNGTIAGGLGNFASGIAFPTIGGGSSNTASSSFATVGGGGSNTAGGQGAVIAGGQMNAAAGNYATVSGGTNNTASGEGAAIGGGVYNLASGRGATVAGGGYNGFFIIPSQAAGIGGFIGGGYGNLINVTADYAAIGGGGANVISGTGTYATVGGGRNNSATSSYSTVGGGRNGAASNAYATIGGGDNNIASDVGTTVGGGESNSATDNYATVPGGYHNQATGYASFAAGYQARALHQGAFVWSDSSVNPISSTVSDQFMVRASGGVTLFTNSTATSGVRLGAGGGSWISLSDRNAKANFAAVDGVAILEALARVPVETWNYNSQDPAIRHIGPMSQDLYSAFGVGETDTGINTVDADGIALAAIQGLYTVVQAKDAQIVAQQSEISDLQSRMAALEAGGSPAPSLMSVLPWVLFAGLAGYALAQRRAVPAAHS